VASTIDVRPALLAVDPRTDRLARELTRLARGMGLRGCVLISYTDATVSVNVCGAGDVWGRSMEQLAERVLAVVDDGTLDTVGKR
jgi:hypothetical protein